jgi:hypothetical protein
VRINTMPYYIDASKVTLDSLQKRIEETDLVPSRESLKVGINQQFKKLHLQGITNLEDLRQSLKNAKRIPTFAEKAGIESSYLVLLRREFEGYFPKPDPIDSFTWLPKELIQKLIENGLKNTVIFFDELSAKRKRIDLSKSLRIDRNQLELLYTLINLTRIQWVSPGFARILATAGFDTPEKITRAVPEKLCIEIDKSNKEHAFFKGKIGLRDVNRLIKAASYVD